MKTKTRICPVTGSEGPSVTCPLERIAREITTRELRIDRNDLDRMEENYSMNPLNDMDPYLTGRYEGRVETIGELESFGFKRAFSYVDQVCSFNWNGKLPEPRGRYDCIRSNWLWMNWDESKRKEYWKGYREEAEKVRKRIVSLNILGWMQE